MATEKFDQIIAKTSISKEHAKEAREVSGELAQAVIDEGMSETYAKTTAKIRNAYLVQCSRLLGVSPRAIAEAQGWRVKKHGGLKDQAEAANGSAIEQAGPEFDVGSNMPETVLIDVKEVAAKDGVGNYVGRNEQEIKAFYRWFDGVGDDGRGVGRAPGSREVADGALGSVEVPKAERRGEGEGRFFFRKPEWTYRKGSNRIRFAGDRQNPRVFYHGTNAVFDTVEIRHSGKLDSEFLGTGFYLLSDKECAEVYGVRNASREPGKHNADLVIGVYARALNPAEASEELFDGMGRVHPDYRPALFEALRKQLIEQGFDSVYVIHTKGPGKGAVELCVFDPSQVKAARSMQNERGRPNGTYDPNDNMFHQPLFSRYPTAARRTEDGDTQMLYADYSVAPQTATAVIAVLSPQKGGFENVSMGERILDVVFAKRGFAWTDEMTKMADAVARDPNRNSQITDPYPLFEQFRRQLQAKQRE